MSELLVGLLVAVGLFVYLLVRNRRVMLLRLDLIRQVAEAAEADIDAGNFNWRWRYQAIDDVSHEAMLFSIKPLRAESYYKDLSFLRRSA